MQTPFKESLWSLEKRQNVKSLKMFQFCPSLSTNSQGKIWFWQKSTEDSVINPNFSEQLCAYNSDKRKGPCIGDSGGPIFVIENNRFTQQGIFSSVDGSCREGFNDYPGKALIDDWASIFFCSYSSVHENDSFQEVDSKTCKRNSG